MFTLTSAAARQIRQATDPGDAALALRVAARRDAAGELHCGMGFDEPNEDDTQLDLHGVAVVIAEEHQALLSDTVLDYVELEPGQFHFIFADSRLILGDDVDATTSGGGGCGSGGCAGGGCAGKATP